MLFGFLSAADTLMQGGLLALLDSFPPVGFLHEVDTLFVFGLLMLFDTLQKVGFLIRSDHKPNATPHLPLCQHPKPPPKRC